MKLLLLLTFCFCYIPISSQDLANKTAEALELVNERNHEKALSILADEIANYRLNFPSDSLLVKAYLVMGKAASYQWNFAEAEKYYLQAATMSKEIHSDKLYLKSATQLVRTVSYLQKFDTLKILTTELLAKPDLSLSSRSDFNILLASYHENATQLDSAIYYAEIAASIDSIHQDSSSLPFTYFDLGRYYVSDNNYEKGIKKILYALEYLPIKPNFKRASIEIGLAEVYYKIGNIKKSLEISKNVIEYASKANLHVTQTIAYLNIGNCYSYLNEHEKALSSYMKADSVNNVKIKNSKRSKIALLHVVNTKLDLGVTITKDEIAKLYEIENSNSDPPYFKNRVKKLFLRLDNYSIDEFETIYEELYRNINPHENLYETRTFLQIKKHFYLKKEMFEKALSVDVKIDSLNKALLQKSNNFDIQELDAKYQKARQDNEIKILDQQNQLKDKLVKQQGRLIKIVSFALLLVSIMSYFLFRLFNRSKQQKKLISKTLEEKEILLREIHHRVKNNLQLVSSLLTMQGQSIDNEMALEAINEGKSRVRSMALIHQDLYNREDLTGIGVKKYLEKLAAELFSTYRVDDNRINLHLDIEEIELDIDIMVPLGLIINELITNCLKYAFPNSRKGNLTVTLRSNGKHIKLEVFDDGIGFNLNDVAHTSFGTSLVLALTEQLEGALHTSNEQGMSNIITFPNKLKEL